MLRKNRSVFIIMSVSLLIFIAAGFVSYLVSISKRDTTVWKGYYQLIFDENTDLKVVAKDLKSIGIVNFISESTEKIPLFSFDKNIYTPVSSIKDYYVEGDPLYDPFLKGVTAYFHGYADGRKVKIVYIPETDSVLKTYLHIRKALSQDNFWWSMVDFQPLKRLLFILFACILNLFLYFFARKKKAFFFISLISWIFPLFFGDLETLIAAASCQLSWILFSDQIKRNIKYYLNYRNFDPELAGSGIVSLVFTLLICISVFILFSGNGGFAVILVSYIMMISGTVLLMSYQYHQHTVRIHRIFFPVRILEKRKCFRLNEIYAAGFFFIFLLVIPLLFHVSVSFEKVAVPVPYRLTGDTTLSLDSLRRLSHSHKDAHIPDLGDFVAHMAFIDGYQYGREYKFPEKDEKINVPVFRTEQGLVYRENLMVNMFTDAWYHSIITPGSSTGLITLLVNQEMPVAVKSVNLDQMFTVRERFGTYYIYYLFLLIPFLFWISGRVTFPEEKVKRLFIRRRRQVV